MNLTDKQKESARIASQNVSDIEFLLGRNEFTNMMVAFKTRADALADEVLHNDELTPVEREASRQKRLGILEVLQYPAIIRNGGLSVLKSLNVD